MPTTTWRTMRRELLRPFGVVEVSTTTDIAAGTAVVSTELQSWFDNDDYFINGPWFVTVVIDDDGGTPANGLGTTTRRATDYDSSNGTLTTTGPNWSLEDEAVEVDLYRHFHPTDVLRAYNRARQLVFPDLGSVRDTYLVTGDIQTRYTEAVLPEKIWSVELERKPLAEAVTQNPITDPGFEDWSSATALNSWTLSGTGASVNQETDTVPEQYGVMEGTYSARIYSASSGTTTLTQTVTPTGAIEGMEANLRVWVYCQTASRVAARIDSTDGTAHAGLGWELLSVAVDIANATTLDVTVNVSAGSQINAYADEAILSVGPSERIEKGWHQVRAFSHTPPIQGASDSGILEFAHHQLIPAKRLMRVKGLTYLSGITVDTGTVELDNWMTEPLYNCARYILCEEKAFLGPGVANIDWERERDRYYALWKAGPRLWRSTPRIKSAGAGY